MGKFKVGNRVRFVMDYGHAKKGDEGSVVGFWGEDGAVVSHKTVNHSCNFSRIELVPAWQPKVGDQVRLTKNNPNGGATYGKKGEIVEVATSAHHSDHYGDQVKVKHPADTWAPSAPVSALEPLPVAEAPTLTITAGKFYKTRDGRKVGPISVAQGPDDPWPWKLASGTHYYRNDGFSCPGWADGHRHADDLIAEWVDEPSKASNDNAAPAKFKVGDRIVALEDSAFSVKKGTVYTVIDVYDENIRFVRPDGKTDGWNAKFFAAAPTTTPAIVALIENGVAKPATRPVVHASQEAATAEAARLALKHPGQEFGVFVLADSKIADVVEEIVKKTVLRPAA
ncbi:hypothetical protein HFN71_28490 [Rhizobium laguerreae]|uniref:hypothetical protein n=1 Tax=Rhizobium laguerreae TaxID=1076926 RepID=UPI001C90A197|nr:hypothetical protein [Rhizobium laguerreae]MBY3543625.1 hypothetical protein [Rhizobium laguerreae]